MHLNYDSTLHQKNLPVNKKFYGISYALIPAIVNNEPTVVKRVLAFIMERANPETLFCHITAKTIAKELNISLRSVRKAEHIGIKKYKMFKRTKKGHKLTGDAALLKKGAADIAYLKIFPDLIFENTSALEFKVKSYLDSLSNQFKEYLEAKPNSHKRGSIARRIAHSAGVAEDRVYDILKIYKTPENRKEILIDLCEQHKISDIYEKGCTNSRYRKSKDAQIVGRRGVECSRSRELPESRNKRALRNKQRINLAIYSSPNQADLRSAGLDSSSEGAERMTTKRITTDIDKFFNSPASTEDKPTPDLNSQTAGNIHNTLTSSDSKSSVKRIKTEGRQSDKLRMQRKEAFTPQAAKKQPKLPKVNKFQQKVVDDWNEAGLKKHSLINTQNKPNKYFKESLLYLKLLLTGRISDLVEDDFKEFFSRKFTEEEVLNVFQCFIEAFKNPNAVPEPDSRLYEICRKNLTIKDFIYSTGKWTGNGPTSLFKQFAEKGIQTAEHKEDDLFPDGTLKLMHLYTKEFKSGVGKLTHADEYKFRLASNRLFDLYHEEYSDRILWDNKTQTKAQILELCKYHHESVVESIESMRASNISIQPNPGWYCSKKGLHDRLPKYLTEHSLLTDNYHSLDPKNKRVAKKKWSPDFKPHTDYAPKKQQMPFSIYN